MVELELFRHYQVWEARRDGYPRNWPLIAGQLFRELDGRCVRCGHRNDPDTAHIFTVHHLDGDKLNCTRENLVGLCQRCHLRVQSSNWLSPYYPVGQLPLFAED